MSMNVKKFKWNEMYQIKASDIFDYVKYEFNDSEYITYIIKTFKIENKALHFILNQMNLNGLDMDYEKLFDLLKKHVNSIIYDSSSNVLEMKKVESINIYGINLNNDDINLEQMLNIRFKEDTFIREWIKNILNKYILSLASEIDLYLIIKCVSMENLFEFEEDKKYNVESFNILKSMQTSYKINGIDIVDNVLKGKLWIFNTPNHPFEIFLRNKYDSFI